MTAGLSQKAFAESIGVSQSAVGYYENRSRKISETIWPKITTMYHDVLEQLGIPEEIQEEPEKALVLSPKGRGHQADQDFFRPVAKDICGVTWFL